MSQQTGTVTSARKIFNPADFGATKSKSTQVIEIKTAEQRFEIAGNIQLANLRVGKQGTKLDWYRLMDDGSVNKIALRNGVAMLEIDGMDCWHLPDVPTAIAFFEAAIEAAKAGEFEEQFASTKKVK
jgi:hypothetical protein